MLPVMRAAVTATKLGLAVAIGILLVVFLAFYRPWDPSVNYRGLPPIVPAALFASVGFVLTSVFAWGLLAARQGGKWRS
jgi:uncharacterized BrkB/YihY/UPF0761 family membrane protein